MNLFKIFLSFKKEKLASNKQFSKTFLTLRNQEIWDAITTNDTQSLKKLLKGKEWTESELFDASGTDTMLHKAAYLGHTDVLQCLIDNTGAKPDLLNA